LSHPTCPTFGCTYPEGECSGACRTDRRPVSPGMSPLLPIDFAVPDAPPQGDPWPRHQCMPSVDRPEPLGALLREDRAAARSCPSCNHDCDQGDTCPERLQSSEDFGAWTLQSVLLALAVFWAAVVFGLVCLGSGS